jgi:hypothetical protein
MKTHAVLEEYRDGGADIGTSGTLEDCIAYCVSQNTPEEFNDPENFMWGNEETTYSIVEL